MISNWKATVGTDDRVESRYGIWILISVMVGLQGFAFGQQSEVLEPLPREVSGVYYDSVLVQFFNQTVGAEIYYTLNGDTPTTNSSRYTSPFYLKETSKIKAIAVKNGASSRVHHVSYYILARPSGWIRPSRMERIYSGNKVVYSLVGRRNPKKSANSVLIAAQSYLALSM